MSFTVKDGKTLDLNGNSVLRPASGSDSGIYSGFTTQKKPKLNHRFGVGFFFFSIASRRYAKRCSPSRAHFFASRIKSDERY